MGELKDRANQQSKFLIIAKGGTAVVRFLDYRFVPSALDPTIDVVQYKVEEDGKEKFWTNGSAAVMRVMDEVEKGSWIRIIRNPWMSKDGKEDINKSSYMVEKLPDEIKNGGRVKASKGSSAKKEEEVWDE